MADYESTDAKIDEMYRLHDNPALIGMSAADINNHPEIAFPDETNERRSLVSKLFAV